MNIEEARATFRSPNSADYPELAGYARAEIYDTMDLCPGQAEEIPRSSLALFGRLC